MLSSSSDGNDLNGSGRRFNDENNDENIESDYMGLGSYVTSIKPSKPKPVKIIGTYPGYKLIKEIGSGFFGKVYEAIRNTDERSIALKVVNIDPNKPEALNDLKREISVLTKISDPTCQPYLVCFLGYKYLEDENLFLIEMDMVQGKTLAEFSSIYRLNRKFPKYLLLIMKDLIKAIKYLHKHNIIHNDIKPDNIIIDPDLNPVLVDMGVACMNIDVCSIDTEQKECCHGIKGPNMYLSPETIMTKGGYFKESDIWGLGLTFYVAVKQDLPFNLGPVPTVQKLINAVKTQEPLKLRSGDEILDHIVNRCLDKNINTRITLDEISKILEDI